MRYGISALLIGTALLSACSSNDSNDDSLAGTWMSESCDQMSNADNEPVSVWAKTQYEFWNSGSRDNGGSILGTTRAYTNADCSGESQIDSFIYPEDHAAMTYGVLGSATADNGLPALRVRFSWTFPSGGEFDETSLVQMTGGRLCLPTWLTLGAGKFSVGTGSSADIDYSYGRCLIRD